jgi:predicted helicase
MGLGEDVSDRIEIVGVGAREELEATTAVVDDIKPKKRDGKDVDDEPLGVREPTEDELEEDPEQLAFVLSDLSKAIKAKIVERCGTRDYWENWAKDIAKIAQAHITRIKTIVFNSGTKERKLFEEFVAEIRDDLNPSITEEQAVEMLAQHLVTKPVFETLFQDHKFTEENPVSKAMQSILTALSAHKLEKESDSLQKFYESVKRRAADIETTTGRQTLILELYERFFSYAFKSMTERLGIVYTPVEVVDFIVRSIEDVLQEEFGRSVSDRNVHVLDPFVGTGTFITRLMQSGIIKPEDLKRKFESEIHANELVLLAYYIASINAESVYQDLTEDQKYRPFDGIVLTDTFQLYEEGKDMIANLLPDNSNRRKNQKSRKINVIIGNPPYSAGQKNANDNAANLKYLNLDQRIEATYADASTATNKNSLYDSYIRAFRLASDRIGDEGVIGFVTGAGWIDGNATDGMRKCLVDEFDKIYVFNLRGNARTSGEARRKESGNVFGEGSRTPIAVTILVRKKGASPRKGKIFYCDIGDYFDREEKLKIISLYASIGGITKQGKWTMLLPDQRNDWINQGSDKFDEYVAIGDKSARETEVVFALYSSGLKSGRDAWCYNFSRETLSKNMRRMIDNYNLEVGRHKQDQKHRPLRDSQLISWNRGLLHDFDREKIHAFSSNRIYRCLYRPFTRTYVYFDRPLNDMVYQWYKLLPTSTTKNSCIAVTGIGAKEFSVLAAGELVDLQFLFNSQVFPLRVYDADREKDLFGEPQEQTKSAISPSAVGVINSGTNNHEDVFYTIYALLHHETYRKTYASDLVKTLPRIPRNLPTPIVSLMTKVGKMLYELHTGFDSVRKYPVTIDHGQIALATDIQKTQLFRVEKMKFAGTRGKEDRSTVIYNDYITITNIPLEAYEYVVNGKPALEWVMERQCVKVDKDSGIVNDANDYANETMNNPAYPLELFQRVITVSLETMKIVKALPKLDL